MRCPGAMKAPTLAVSAGVALICAAILVLFTDIELSVLRWVNCGPFTSQNEDRIALCRQNR
jgi:hypothetical protein